MKHVAVLLNVETLKLDIVLQWRLAPIGPRLEKNVQMPGIASTGYADPAMALTAARQFDEWLIKQEEPEPKKRVVVVEKPLPPTPPPKPVVVVQPKPTPPPPKAAPPVVHQPKPRPPQTDLFSDL